VTLPHSILSRSTLSRGGIPITKTVETNTPEIESPLLIDDGRKKKV